MLQRKTCNKWIIGKQPQLDPSFLAPRIQLSSTAETLNVSAALDVGVGIGLGFRRERAIGRPEVNEVLHGLQLCGLQHVERRCG